MYISAPYLNITSEAVEVKDKKKKNKGTDDRQTIFPLTQEGDVEKKREGKGEREGPQYQQQKPYKIFSWCSR